jgi:[ribosomal protein S18]-alanine N-acetyltransferase
LKHTLTGFGNREFEIQVVEIDKHNPELIAQVMEIDLLTFSEPTWSRYTAGLMLRHGRTFLLRVDGALVGTCQCMRSWERPSEAALFSMTIRPGWRGQGLGSLFLEEVINGLATSGITSVAIEVDPNNPVALRLYQSRFGFEFVRDCADEYGQGHHRIHLRREISRANNAQEISLGSIQPAVIKDEEILLTN